MATRGIIPNLKFLVRRSQLIGQLRSSHVMQLTQCSINNSSSDAVKSNCNTKLSLGPFLNPHNLNCSIIQRWKHGKKQKTKSSKYDSDDDDDDGEADNEENMYMETIAAHSKNAKIINKTMSSMRIDTVVKAALNMARNKVEVALYEGKLRINGKKPIKKGVQIQIDDVIDFVEGPSPKNENFLLVSRITILHANLDENNYKVKMLREKSLVIENYSDSWQPASNES